MRRLILLLLMAAPAAFPYASYSGWCEQGGVKVTLQGMTSTTPFQQSYPNAAQSGAGPHVTVYQTGTTNKLTLYSDNAGTPLANPLPCTATGQYLFYSPANIADLLFSGTGISSFTRASIGGSTQQVSVTDFGATCAGTSHDDATAITAAITSLATSGGTVNFPAGTCRVNSIVYVPKNGIRLVGVGSGSAASPPAASVIDCYAATRCVVFAKNSDITGASGDLQNWGMENLTVAITNNSNNNVFALSIGNTHVNGHLTNVRIEDYGSFGASRGHDAIEIESGSAGGGFIADMVWTNVNAIGSFNLCVATGSTSFGITQWIWNGGQCTSTASPGANSTAGFFLRRVQGALIQNVDLENWDTGLTGDNTSQNTFNLRMEGNTLDYNLSVSSTQNTISGTYSTITETTPFSNSRSGSVKIGPSVAITAATNANPVVFTVTGSTQLRPLQAVTISGGTGSWVAVNGAFTATPITETTFSIAVDSSGFGAVTGSLIEVPATIQEWVMATDTNFASGSTQQFNGTISTNMTLAHAPAAGRSIFLSGSGANTGYLRLQAGPGSAAFGGSLLMYGHGAGGGKHGDVVAGISNGSTGCFRVNSSADDAGTDWFSVCSGVPVGPSGLRAGPASTFSLLPSCVAGKEGTMASVTDSTTNTWGATITGSGANHVGAYCDGTNWTVFSK